MRADLLAQLIRDGCDIRILAVQPDSQSISQVSQIDPTIASMAHPVKALANRISYNLAAIYNICSGQLSPKGTLEIRTLDYVPPFAFLGVDYSSKTRRVGSLKVELFAHAPHGERPQIVLREDHDSEWYRFFLDQFEQFWERGNKWPRQN